MRPILFLATGLILLASCGGGESGGSLGEKKAQLKSLRADMAKLEKEIALLDTTKVSGRTRLIATTPIVASTFNHYVELQGSIVADQDIYVTPKMPGTITRVLVKNGDQVKQGQLLAELDGALFVQNKAALQTQIDLAINLYNRQKQLWDQKIGTEMQYVQAKAGVEALEKQMAVLAEQADMTKVYAPISGVVDDVSMKVGQPASPGVMMSSVHILNLSKLKAKAEAPESYAGKLRDGAAVLLDFPDLNRSINSKISYVSKMVNPLNRTFSVEVAIPAGQKDLIPNLTTMVKIADYSRPNTIVVPVNTIQRDLEGDFVFIAVTEGGELKARKARVVIGKVFGDGAEILSGLQAGQQLVTTGFQEVNEGETLITN
jgi:membrane fusion protein, multidrug efflux system